MSSRILTYERLREVLNYDLDTGVFTRKISFGSRAWIGKRAESISTSGHAQVFLDGRLYAAHRLAWLFIHRSLPTGQIDHINGVRNDNRIANLREVTASENCRNKRAARSDSTSSLIGVSPHGDNWRARIQTDSGRIHLGTFPTAHLANLAYLEAKRNFHNTCTI